MAMDSYNDQVKDATFTALLSGGLSGAGLGAVSKLMGSAKRATPKELLKAAILGGSVYGGLSGGSTALGSYIMGPPKEDDPSAFTMRGGVGGGVAGGALGAGLGAAVAGGAINAPKQIPAFAANYLKNLRSSKNPLLKGAGIGAAAIGLPMAFLASDEGMQTDFIRNQVQAAKRRKLEEAYRLIKENEASYG